MLQVDKQLTRKFELVTVEHLEEHLYQSLERRELPAYFPYLGDAGVYNWLGLENSRDFTLGCTLTDFLAKSLPYLAEHFIPEFNLVSLGVGNGKKERILLESLMRIGSPSYYSIDISSAMVDTALNTVADLAAEKTGLVAFFEDLPIVKRLWCHPVLLCMLGNTLSNGDADRLLATVGAQLEPSDLFLFDCYLYRGNLDRMVNELRSPGYVRFKVLPLILRGLEPDAARFVVEPHTVDTPFGPVHRIDKHLHILAHSVIAFEPGNVVLLPGEKIHLGTMYQYTLAQVHQLVSKNGLSIVERHLDVQNEKGAFLVHRQKTSANL